MTTTHRLCATGLGLAMATTSLAALAQDDVTIRWALHPGEEADAVVDYFAPEYERQTGIKVEGEILPPDQLRDRMSIEAIGGTGRWDMGYPEYCTSVASLAWRVSRPALHAGWRENRSLCDRFPAFKTHCP
ncbi:hypothetical protein, partial [Halomonas sp.]|uniref:hypothetical protein n=1 Tax=Halomonas sp. TaxID=1486246 RepID=UPI00298D98B4